MPKSESSSAGIGALSARVHKAAVFAAALAASGIGALPAAAQGIYVPAFDASKLYLRGSAGAAFGTDMNFTDVDPNDPSAVLGPGASLNGKGNTSAIFSGGIGYRFSPAFWADVTASGIPDLKFSRGSTSAGAFTPLTGMSAKIDSVAVLLNGYVDVARAFRLPVGPWQPYVVGSAGYARNHMDAMTGTVPGFGPVSFTGSTHEDFAWGIGAGVGFPIARNIVLDLQYEYLDLGEVRSGNSGTLTIGGIPTTAAAGPMKADHTAHTIQASFRVNF